MDSFIPFFPLKLVAFPGEQLNLHIFEPRYKQLTRECLNEGKTFGIPVYHKNEIMDFGTEMRITRLVRTYPTGEMDINTVGLRAFKIHSFEEQVKGKLYAGGKVSFLENRMDGETENFLRLRKLVKQLVGLIRMDDRLDVDMMTHSFEMAHKMGLSLEQEYDLLQMTRESQRQEYMINHLERALPIVMEMEQAKEKIKMNGHFKHLDPLNF
ncbi:MAG: LON peptidase substrate-binding domain-containing protein [Roseivirga sp.]